MQDQHLDQTWHKAYNLVFESEARLDPLVVTKELTTVVLLT